MNQNTHPANVVILNPIEAAGLVVLGSLYVVRFGSVRHWHCYTIEYNPNLPSYIAGLDLMIIGQEDNDSYLCVHRSEEKEFADWIEKIRESREKHGFKHAYCQWEVLCADTANGALND